MDSAEANAEAIRAINAANEAEATSEAAYEYVNKVLDTVTVPGIRRLN